MSEWADKGESHVGIVRMRSSAVSWHVFIVNGSEALKWQIQCCRHSLGETRRDRCTKPCPGRLIPSPEKSTQINGEVLSPLRKSSVFMSSEIRSPKEERTPPCQRWQPNLGEADVHELSVRSRGVDEVSGWLLVASEETFRKASRFCKCRPGGRYGHDLLVGTATLATEAAFQCSIAENLHTLIGAAIREVGLSGITTSRHALSCDMLC